MISKFSPALLKSVVQLLKNIELYSKNLNSLKLYSILLNFIEIFSTSLKYDQFARKLTRFHRVLCSLVSSKPCFRFTQTAWSLQTVLDNPGRAVTPGREEGQTYGVRHASP